MTGFLLIVFAIRVDHASIHKTNLVSMFDREYYFPAMSIYAVLFVFVLITLAILAFLRLKKVGRPVPDMLRPGQSLPDFHAVDESGDPVRSTELHGTAAVILFVRGNWCPFCSSQVENLTVHYKDIINLGARLILITPKPQETTRRVAEFFEVEFDFWLDEDLSISRQLGLLLESGVPEAHRKEYGNDTIWPTALVVDPNGIIRYTSLSKLIADRPNSKTLLRELRGALGK